MNNIKLFEEFSKGGRVAKKITMEDLKSKLKPMLENDDFPYELSVQITKDLSKVKFDFENYEYEEGEQFGELPCGYKTLANGMPVLFINAGGDWEAPICFILYWDGKQIRAYIPKNGNTWNTEFNTAYGSEEESDKYEKKYNPQNLSTYDSPDTEEAPEAEPEKIYADIINRIKLVD